MIFGANAPFMLAASESWLTRWLTPFWIFGVGIFFGLLALAVVYGIIYALSFIPFLQTWRRKSVSFWVGAGASAIVTAILAVPLQQLFRVRGSEEIVRSEWLLSLPTVFAFFAIIFWTLLYCSNRRFIDEFTETLTVGIGAHIFTALCVVVVLAGVATIVVEEPVQMITSLPSIMTQGESSQTVVLKGVAQDAEAGLEEAINLDYNPQSLQQVIVKSDRNIVLSVKGSEEDLFETPVRISAQASHEWYRGASSEAPIPTVAGSSLTGQNLEYDEATVTFFIRTASERPEMFAVFVLGLISFLIGIVWFLQLGASPRLAAIAMATAKSEISQPLPKILILFGALCIAAFVFIPFHTLGEDIKLLKDCGITLIMVVCLFQGIWSASSTVSDEIEGRTALTLLSKPIHRRSFIFGKLLGILWVLMLMIIVLGAIELVAVGYKPLYDARENSLEQPLWQQGYVEMIRTVPGIVMVFFQVTTLTSLAVALATRLPQLANFAVCFSVYLIGHLTPSIVSSSQDAFPIVQFVAQLIAVVTPNLDLFSMNGAIDANTPIPGIYISGLFLYSVLFCGLTSFIGLLLFEDRDLA